MISIGFGHMLTNYLEIYLIQIKRSTTHRNDLQSMTGARLHPKESIALAPTMENHGEPWMPGAISAARWPK